MIDWKLQNHMFPWPSFRAAPDAVWILRRPTLLHICVYAALWHGNTLHLQHSHMLIYSLVIFYIFIIITSKHFDMHACTMHLPGSVMACTHVYDPLDPDTFWETLGGRQRPCRALWDRWGDSSGPRKADDNNNNNNNVVLLRFWLTVKGKQLGLIHSRMSLYVWRTA